MITVEEILAASSAQRKERARWGKPFVESAVAHAAALSLIITLLAIAPKPLEPIRVLEISVMGPQDLKLKGTADDYNVGPMEDKTLMSQPAGAPEKPVAGNTAKVSRSASRSQAAAAVLMPPKPVAGGVLFDETAASAAQPGVGREKIHIWPPESSLAAFFLKRSLRCGRRGFYGRLGRGGRP